MGEKARHLSMLRSYTAADFLTLANASCGTISIFLCLAYLSDERRTELWAAFVLPFGALIFDVLDGYVARLNKKRQSLLGADLDSLSDIVSFGVAPAVLAYTLGARGLWDVLCLTYFVCCGISRLARFNVTSAALTDADTGKVKYFQGTPIPTSIVLVLLLGILFRFGKIGENLWMGEWQVLSHVLHPVSLLFVLSGSGMISATLKVPKP
jgi:CDP-diacylglycerol---serine O-phosphatidyltransferase